MNTLIVYFSKYGQTEAIANRIADVVRRNENEATVVNAREALSLESIDSYDAVILGSPIYTNKHSKQLKQFIEKHIAELRTKHTAFFSVSLSAAGDDSQQNDATACMNSYLDSCQWSPNSTAIFAGSLPYRQYNIFVRWLMKRIVRKSGGDTDTSRNYEYTDWNRVEAFAEQLSRS